MQLYFPVANSTGSRLFENNKATAYLGVIASPYAAANKLPYYEPLDTFKVLFPPAGTAGMAQGYGMPGRGLRGSAVHRWDNHEHTGHSRRKNPANPDLHRFAFRDPRRGRESHHRQLDRVGRADRSGPLQLAEALPGQSPNDTRTEFDLTSGNRHRGTSRVELSARLETIVDRMLALRELEVIMEGREPQRNIPLAPGRVPVMILPMPTSGGPGFRKMTAQEIRRDPTRVQTCTRKCRCGVHHRSAPDRRWLACGLLSRQWRDREPREPAVLG